MKKLLIMLSGFLLAASLAFSEEFNKNPYSSLAPILDEKKVKVFLDNQELNVY
jgi:hypothetical protein